MRIRVAILEKDAAYLSRITSAFGQKYADKLEIYSFTDPEQAKETVFSAKIDVFLVGDDYPGIASTNDNRCATAFLVNSSDVESLNGIPTICRFQKIDLIYKQILGLYAEQAKGVVEKSADEGEICSRVICFTSPAGGTGASSMAAACALHYARQNYRVMYLNLEQFGGAEEYFTGEGVATLSDVIYAVKSGKANLPLRLESYVRHDPRGVSFYARPKIALDMMEFHTDAMSQLIRQLRKMNSYDVIVFDMDYSMDEAALQTMGEASSIVWISDGTTTANGKLLSALAALKVLDTNRDSSLERHLCLIYNKFSNKSGVTMPENTLKFLGGAPRFDQASSAQVIEKLSEKPFFDSIE